MRFLTVLFNIALLICPCALCYGQLSFSSVNGEGGYAAMRGQFVLNLDNGFSLIPSGGYYRTTDKEEDVTGAAGKVALDVEYALSDYMIASLGGYYIPRRMGFEGQGYHGHLKTFLCYHCGWLKNPYLQAGFEERLYDITAYADGRSYPGHFRTQAPVVMAEIGSELGKFFVQARYDKVIKYNHRPPTGIASNWTEIPFMTAIVQGFVRDIASARITYRASWITPYVVYARYKYMEHSDYTVSVAGGLALHWGQSIFSGGVEVFEQNREQNRRTYFSMSASTTF